MDLLTLILIAWSVIYVAIMWAPFYSLYKLYKEEKKQIDVKNNYYKRDSIIFKEEEIGTLEINKTNHNGMAIRIISPNNKNVESYYLNPVNQEYVRQFLNKK